MKRTNDETSRKMTTVIKASEPDLVPPSDGAPK